jgi:hypothetical protein
MFIQLGSARGEKNSLLLMNGFDLQIFVNERQRHEHWPDAPIDTPSAKSILKRRTLRIP